MYGILLPIIVVTAAGLLFTALILIALNYRTVVATNSVHIVQTSHARISYGGVDAEGNPRKNTYYAWPSWIPLIGVKVSVLPLSVFDLPLDNYGAYDKGRLPFVIDIMAFFRVNDSGIAAERVASFEELKDQLHSILKGASRTILATSDIEPIMESRAVFGQKFTEEVSEQLKQWGVTPVKNIELMDIRDAAGSNVIANIMAKKKSEIEKESRIAVALNMKDAQSAEIENQREVEMRKQEAAETVGRRTADAQMNIGISQQKAEQAVQEEAKTTAEKNMAVKSVEHVRAAEINRSVELVNADKVRQAQIIAADASKQTAITIAEGQKQQTVLKAEADLTTATLNAQGTEAEGRAVGVAETARLMAPVTAQVELAEKIGANQSYQTYLINIEQVKANQAVGVEQAKALVGADVRIIVNGNSPAEGASSVMDLFTPKGATQLGAAIEAMRNVSETVSDGLAKVTGNDSK